MGIRWEYCSVPNCNDCKTTQLGQEYNGTLSVTKNGNTCQQWSSQYPHNHYMKNYVQYFPENSLTEAQNFCRNPDGESDGPWCYTTSSSIRWEYCSVPYCF